MKVKRKHIVDFFANLDFNAEKHQYKYRHKHLSSVSSKIKNYVKPFNAELIAGFVAKGRKVPVETVLQEWEDLKNVACDKGNRVHLFGEKYPLDNSLIPIDGHEEAVVSYWKSLPKHITPCLFELQMFSEKMGLAGTADIILYNELTEKFIIADYKTNKDIFKNHKNQKMLIPFNHLLDSPYNKYQVQLSIYQHLFEQTGFEVEDRVLIWLLPDGTFKTYNTQHVAKGTIF